MFLLNRNIERLIEYKVELIPGKVSEILLLGNFYENPDSVVNYQFPEGKTTTFDETMLPTYKFIQKISKPKNELNFEYTIKKDKIVEFSTDGTKNDHDSPHLNAFVNLDYNTEFVFYKRDPVDQSYNDVTHDDLSEDVVKNLADPENSFTETFDDAERFLLDVNYNSLIIYDPSDLHLISQSTFYQVIRI